MPAVARFEDGHFGFSFETPKPSLTADEEGWLSYELTDDEYNFWDGSAWHNIPGAVVTPTANKCPKANGSGHIDIGWLADDSVTLAKLSEMAGSRIMGRDAAGGNPQHLTPSQARTVLELVPDDVTVQINSGNLRVKDLGISTNKLANDAVTAAKILNNEVLNDKLELMASGMILANSHVTDNAPEHTAFWGTSFPGSDKYPGMHFYRTDLKCGFFWSGTNWLSTEVYSIPFGATASITAYMRQYPIATAPLFTATYGERYGFDVVVVGISIEVGASSTCTVTVQDDGANVTGGAISLSSQTVKQDEALESSTIAAGSAIGVEVTSGTASTWTNGCVRLRRVAT